MKRTTAAGLALTVGTFAGACEPTEHRPQQSHSQESAASTATHRILEKAFTKDKSYWEKKVGYLSVRLVYVRPGETKKCDGSHIEADEVNLPAKYCNTENTVIIPSEAYSKFLSSIPTTQRKEASQIVVAHELGHAVQDKRSGRFPEGEQPDAEKMADCFAGATIRRTVASQSARTAIHQSLFATFSSAAKTHPKVPGEAHGSITERIAAYDQGYDGSDCGRLLK